MSLSTFVSISIFVSISVWLFVSISIFVSISVWIFVSIDVTPFPVGHSLAEPGIRVQLAVDPVAYVYTTDCIVNDRLVHFSGYYMFFVLKTNHIVQY